MSIMRYAYYYAVIRPETGKCYMVLDTTDYVDDPCYIAISEANDEYLGKYYNVSNNKWYLEASFTTEWIPE